MPHWTVNLNWTVEVLSRNSVVISALLVIAWWLAPVAFAPGLLPPSGFTRSAVAQDNFNKLSSQHLDLITDLPLDDSLRELPEVFDAALPMWCKFFGVDESETKNWRASVCIMLDRQRFKTAGLLPDELPEFPHGYQWNDAMWVVEQPTQYYRRHLLLHEGTHWFMFRKFGSAGPPWLMEGTAEWLATHRWDDGKLQLGIIPRSRADVPMWGRITLIQDQLAQGIAPSMETILRYDNRAHQSVDAYAWSWAAVIFLSQNPHTQKAFMSLFDDQLRNDATPTKQLLRAIQPRKAMIRAEWSAMLTGIEYGFRPERELVVLDHRARPLTAPVTVKISAAKGWQSAGVTVANGDTIQFTASGQFIVGTAPKPWKCEADGVTLRYVQGQPLGKLLMAIATPKTEEPPKSQTLPVIPLGAQRTIQADASGQLLLRVNDYGAELEDNSGEITVTITPS